MIKKIIISVITSLLFASFAFSQDEDKLSFGAKVMIGGRYDDVRMCVASDAGVKGGMIADIMLLTRWQKSENFAIMFELPVMRPILFILAFDMLQFEPQLNFEFSKSLNDKSKLILSPGVGLSFHYGPDYMSDMENRGKDFFAMGPMVSTMLGYSFSSSKNNKRVIGLRPFYIPLFSADKSMPSGTVLGGVLEMQFYF